MDFGTYWKADILGEERKGWVAAANDDDKRWWMNMYEQQNVVSENECSLEKETF